MSRCRARLCEIIGGVGHWKLLVGLQAEQEDHDEGHGLFR